MEQAVDEPLNMQPYASLTLSEQQIEESGKEEKNVLIEINNLLDSIGNENDDNLSLGSIQINRENIRDSLLIHNSFYTADFIDLLLYSISQRDTNIKVYSAITPEKLSEHFEEIQNQKQNFAFIPLNVAYDKKDDQIKNHWVAVIIDRKNRLMFYLDPIKKDVLPKSLGLLHVELKGLPVIYSPTNFRTQEKDEGWLRHCGVYVIEIFDVFTQRIQKKQCISGGELPDINIDPDSISAKTALSAIAFGLSENIKMTRGKHIREAYTILNNSFVINPARNKKSKENINFAYQPVFKKSSSPQINSSIIPEFLDPSDSIPNVRYVESLIKNYEQNINYSRHYINELKNNLRNELLFEQQKDLAAEGLKAFNQTLPNKEDFISHFHQKGFFKQTSHFCQKVSDVLKMAEIMLEFEKSHTTYQEPDIRNNEIKNRKLIELARLHYEIFCMKYFCSLAVETNDVGLKNLVNQFIKQNKRTESSGWAFSFLLAELQRLYVPVKEAERNALYAPKEFDYSVIPDYIKQFFSRYTGEIQSYILPLHSAKLFRKQMKMGGKDIEGFRPKLPKMGFLAKFHQDSYFNLLERTTFCREVREIILKFEKKYMAHERPLNNPYRSDRWEKRHYELFCMKFFCVKVAQLPDHRELKEFIDKFIIHTEQPVLWIAEYNTLVSELQALCRKCEATDKNLSRSIIIHDEGKKGKEIVLLNTKILELEAKIKGVHESHEQKISKKTVAQEKTNLEREKKFKDGIKICIDVFTHHQGGIFLKENPKVKNTIEELQKLVNSPEGKPDITISKRNM